MVWKILFYVFILLIYIPVIVSDTSQHYHAKYPFTDIIALSFFVTYVFTLGFYYGLGWKKQIYSVKAVKYINIIILISFLCAFVPPIIPFYYYVTHPHYPIPIQLFVIKSIVYFTIALICTLIIYMPTLIGLFRYNKMFKNFESVNKPYWKLFSIIIFIGFSGMLINLFLHKFSNIVYIYNIWDKLSILALTYLLTYVMAYSFDIKIFSQKFWKITSVPFICFFIGVPLLWSSYFNYDMSANYMINNWYDIVEDIIFYTALAIMLYRYAFTDKLWEVNSKDLIEEK